MELLLHRYRSMLQAHAARALTSVWRLNGLRIARHAFAGTHPGIVLTRPLFGHSMPIDVGRTGVHQLLYLEGERFIAERFLLHELLRPDMRVIDAGANIGYYLLLFEQVIGPTGRVLCVEPEPGNLVDLRRVVAANGFLNAAIVPAALGATRGTVHLSAGVNGIVKPDGNLTVPLVRLDDICSPLDRVDFVKIDVEGYEGEVFAGAADLFTTQRPTLFLELHPTMMSGGHTVASVLDTLRQWYPLVDLYELAPADARSKLRSQYLGRGLVSALPKTELLAACKSGERKATCWAVCKRPRAERW